MTKEEWRDIPLAELDGMYQVSNLGNVRRITPVTQHTFTGKKRRYVSLTSPSILKEKAIRKSSAKQKNIFTHRLVAMAFCEKPNGCEFVNHKNGNSMDNRAQNLEWVTMRENYDHARRTGLYKSPKNKKVDAAIAVAMFKDGASIKAIARRFGASDTAVKASIDRHIHGVPWSAGAKERKRKRRKERQHP